MELHLKLVRVPNRRRIKCRRPEERIFIMRSTMRPQSDLNPFRSSAALSIQLPVGVGVGVGVGVDWGVKQV
jgi:hypothetical protein